MPGSCPLIRRLRDPDILTQTPVEQAVAPKKQPPEAYFPRRLSIIGPDLTSEYLFTTMHTRAVRRHPRLAPSRIGKAPTSFAVLTFITAGPNGEKLPCLG